MNKNTVIYSYQDTNGDIQMEEYSLFPGIKLMIHSIHTESMNREKTEKGRIMEIHHCREGRMERTFEDSYYYLMPGDLAIDITDNGTKIFTFPLRHYHGITISINIDLAPKCFSCLLEDVNVRPSSIVEKLCGKQSCFVIRAKEYVEHLFSEMYSVPCENKKGYFKIKVLELMLVLSGINPNENKITSYTLSSSQVELAKVSAAYIAENIDSTITVSTLSKRFHVSSTHLQNAFKGVFGVPVNSYIRIYKMNLAALQLVRTEKTIMEIANECGYDNASKFASAFRKIMNETPLEYRKRHRLIRS